MNDSRCQRCRLRTSSCLCKQTPQVPIPIEIIILRHWKERDRASNTARLIANTLNPVQLFEYGIDDLSELPIKQSESALLFPDIQEYPAPPCPENLTQLIVVDGTWTQVRKMLGRIDGLRTMPRFSVKAPSPPYPRLRTPSVPNGLSTVEAVGAALHKFNLYEAEAALRNANWLLMDTLRATTGIRHPLMPGLSFTDLRLLDGQNEI